ncbi:MAG: 3-deoxy-D-manno-octulosonic acid transferase [Heliomarina sp.]|uniref:3-deoxy-D-manno-octulosonic acid transferase n=1 Tax=Heliomarina sp. TaxID=2917556 RepID=UPI004059EC54
MTAPAASTALFRIYRGLTRAGLPLAFRSVARKLRGFGVSEDRIAERLGKPTEQRPEGPLVWIHAASVGESLAVLTLITRLADRLPAHHFLITSGTATSAELIAKRLPPRTRHQFAPLDSEDPIRRFLGHWRPDAAIFVESEIWPLMLVRTRESGARLALINARLSEKSVQGWQKFPKTAAYVLEQFDLFLTQNPENSANLRAMGAAPDRIETGFNLKSTSAPLPVDDETVSTFRETLGQRPAWIASSTHPGEEEIVLAAHRKLLERHPDLCLILIPRHPERRAEIGQLITNAGMACASRSRGEWPQPDQEVYLADSLGEMGTWYATAPIVLLGGSLLPIGGHNPYEPADAGAAILTGPHIPNFAESYAPLFSLGAAQQVAGAEEIFHAVDQLLSNTEELDKTRKAAAGFARGRQSRLEEVADTVCTALNLAP